MATSVVKARYSEIDMAPFLVCMATFCEWGRSSDEYIGVWAPSRLKLARLGRTGWHRVLWADKLAPHPPAKYRFLLARSVRLFALMVPLPFSESSLQSRSPPPVSLASNIQCKAHSLMWRHSWLHEHSCSTSALT